VIPCAELRLRSASTRYTGASSGRRAGVIRGLRSARHANPCKSRCSPHRPGICRRGAAPEALHACGVPGRLCCGKVPARGHPGAGRCASVGWLRQGVHVRAGAPSRPHACLPGHGQSAAHERFMQDDTRAGRPSAASPRSFVIFPRRRVEAAHNCSTLPRARAADRRRSPRRALITVRVRDAREHGICQTGHGLARSCTCAHLSHTWRDQAARPAGAAATATCLNLQADGTARRRACLLLGPRAVRAALLLARRAGRSSFGLFWLTSWFLWRRWRASGRQRPRSGRAAP